jgi:hypothetical protein
VPAEVEASPAAGASAPPAPVEEVSAQLPSRIVKLGGFTATVAKIDDERKARNLPSLTSKDYRWVLGRPGGIPFSVPVTVIYKPESPDEQTLGTYRIGR